MTPLEAVLKAQRHLRAAAARLLDAEKLIAHQLTAGACVLARSDLAPINRSLDAVTHALRDLADPKRGAR